MGAPSNNFANLPEYALSAAILSVDLDAIGNTHLRPARPSTTSRPGRRDDANDPSAATTARTRRSSCRAARCRSTRPASATPTTCVLTESGRMYTIDNGATPAGATSRSTRGPAGTARTTSTSPGTTDVDTLHLLTAPATTAATRTRPAGNMANTFNSHAAVAGVGRQPVECDYRARRRRAAALTAVPGVDQRPRPSTRRRTSAAR